MRFFTIVLTGSFLVISGAAVLADDDAAQAAALVNQGRYQEAARTYESLASQRPSDAGLFESLGLCYQALGDYSRAVDSLEKAVNLSANPAVPAYSLALLNEALAQDPARAGERRKRLENARAAWRLVLMHAHGHEARAAARHLERLEEDLKDSRP